MILMIPMNIISNVPVQLPDGARSPKEVLKQLPQEVVVCVAFLEGGELRLIVF